MLDPTKKGTPHPRAKEKPQQDGAVLSHFSRVQLFVNPWTVADQTSLSMGFSRQEYCSG